MTKSPIPRPALDQNAIVLGKTRSGKSSAMRFLIEGLLEEDKAPPCIIDPKGDWWGIKLSADGRGAGFPLIIFGGKDNPRADIQINDRSGTYIAELIATGNRPCLIDLGGWRIKERTRFFVDFAATLFKLINHPLYLIIDECHNFAPKGKLFDPEAAEMLHWANRLASEGLGKGVMLLSASQRPQKVHNDYLTSHETLIAKKVIHKADRDALKDWIDGCGDPALGKEVIASIAQLQKPEAWGWSPEIGFGPKKIEFPFFKTYDSFKPQTAQTLGKLKGWASVDLDDVRTKLAKVVEEAKENDPATLKAEIGKLRGDLAKLEKAARGGQPVAPKDDKAALRDREEAFAAGIKQGLADGWGAALAELCSMAGQHNQAVRIAAERASDAAFKGLCDGIEKMATKAARSKGKLLVVDQPVRMPAQANLAASLDTALGAAGRNDGYKRGGIAGDTTAELLARHKATVKVTAPVNGDLGRAKQALLDALAWWESIGRTSADKEVIAFLAGVSAKSSGYQNNMGALRSAGLIEYPGPGLAGLTAEGRALANAPEAPLDSGALQAAIIAQLNSPQRAILEALLDGQTRSKEGLANELGVSAKSSGYQNNLGRLRSLGFIVYPNPGDVAVSNSMFI